MRRFGRDAFGEHCGDDRLVDAIRGKYQIVREIARSNDIVYEAIDNTLGRRIALKELNIASSLAGQARRERIERFNREARAAGKLSHPNIVAVTDCFEQNGRYFIVMEYLEGQTLRDVMQVRGALPLQEAIGIACQVLDALAHAHQNRVIHRDIKPDNIFILPGGLAKLADFGIARLSEEPALTSDGQVFGTPSYMSPEQIEGRGIDHRSDLFSLGVLLYEMLAGRKPFTGDSVISITYAVMNADPPPLNGVPMGVEQVIRRALAKNPLARQTGAAQMKQDLRNAEQTPAVFFPPSQTGMGQTGLGFGAPMQSQSGYASGYGQQPQQAPYTFNAPQMPPAAYPPLQPGGNPLPWGWNSTGQSTAGAPQYQPSPFPSVMPSQPGFGGTGYPPSAHGVVPYASPPYPVAPPAPVFVLTPAGRTFLMAIIAAALIGGGIAAGVIALQNGYSRYEQTIAGQRIAGLIERGAAAYNSGDYAQAATLFRQALEAGPTQSQRNTITKNLAFTYVQEARVANGRGDWRTAAGLYRSAIDASFDYDTPHKELADLLAQHGDAAGAELQRSSANSSAADTTPTHLENRLPSESVGVQPDNSSSVDPQAFMQQQRADARRLIDEGKALLRQGRLDDARNKWQEAVGKAPGTPERDEAEMLLDNNPPPATDPGYPQ
jgi:serine/threonine-protein kinase